MSRFRKMLDIDNMPKIISRIIIVCLILYIVINSYSLFGLPDVKELLEDSGKNVSHTITTKTLKNYQPIIGYVIDDDAVDTDTKEKWQDKILHIASLVLPIYQYVENQNQIVLDKSDPSFTLTYANYDGSKNGEETTQSTDSTQTNANVTIPSPILSGTQYTIEQLSDFDFLVNNFYTISDSTTVYASDLDAGTLMNKDLKMQQDNSKPQILIYHTHSQEGFTDTVEGDANTTIVAVGTYLAEILSQQYGYNVIHDTTSYDLVGGVLDRSKAYDYAAQGVSQILADNPSIEVVLDIHRDGVNDDIHLVTTVNGKQTSKIMFFNGMSRLKDIGDIDYLYNPNLQDNLAMSMQMKMLATAYYPDFTRKNFIKPYEYNLNLRPKSMLIEVGAQTNSLQEEKNAMEPLAVLLNKLLQ